MQPTPMIPLADYSSPTMPTEHALRAAWRRLKERFVGKETDDPMLSATGLERGSSQVLDDLADPPGDAPLLQALEHHLGEWARSSDAAPRMQLIIVPPCDRLSAIEAWARKAGLTLLAPPLRSDLCGADAATAAGDLAGDGVLVIPQLERWFVRQRNGLDAVRSLLTRLAASERRCLIGCDSWAWPYLVKAADAELTLPSPCTFEAFDAARLGRWFSHLAADGGEKTTFRLARNGEDVLVCDDDDDEGEPRSNWLRLLASRSGGIPWVAWHLWRASLQLQSADSALSERAARAVVDDARTVWIADLEDPKLPSSHEDRALLALHALLIHGTLTAAELDAMLPATGDADVLPALVTSGHLRCDRGHYSVRPLAYPAVRQALTAADFPLGAM